MSFLVTGTYILNDSIFTEYGGATGTSTVAQRNAAYSIAEQFAIEEIGTFLVSTTVTGTFEWPVNSYRLQLPHKRVSTINSVVAQYEVACNCDLIDISACAFLVDGDNGVVDLRQCSFTAQCSCAAAQGVYSVWPKFAVVSYTAGLPANQVQNNAAALMGLVIAADLALEQIIDPAGAEGGPGDPSLKSFNDTGYGEVRQFLRLTKFGGSPRANMAARMLEPLKFHGAFRLR